MNWSLQATPGMSDQEFNRWRKLLEMYAGVAVGEQLRSMLQIQINERIKSVGCDNFNEYFEYLQSGFGGRIERCLLVEKLVVNETSFFRHLPSYDFSELAFSLFLDSSAELDYNDKNRSAPCFDVWSLGCSTGEEPYSLAMMFEGLLEEQTDIGAAASGVNISPKYSIVATDISYDAIKKARAGIFNNNKLGSLHDKQLDRYFEAHDAGHQKIKAELKERICFSQSNVVDIDTMPVVLMDLVFTQNMLVYFRKPQRLRILDYITERLKPGGYLVLGLGEVTQWQNPQMQQLEVSGAQVYRRSQ